MIKKYRKRVVRIVNMVPITEVIKEEVKYEYSGDKSSAEKMFTNRGISETVIKDENDMYYGLQSQQGYLIVEGIEL